MEFINISEIFWKVRKFKLQPVSLISSKKQNHDFNDQSRRWATTHFRLRNSIVIQKIPVWTARDPHSSRSEIEIIFKRNDIMLYGLVTIEIELSSRRERHQLCLSFLSRFTSQTIENGKRCYLKRGNPGWLVNLTVAAKFRDWTEVYAPKKWHFTRAISGRRSLK